MASEQKQSKKSGFNEAEEELGTPPAEMQFDIDDLLEDIDDVLEENAEEFVAGYIQKGGQ